MMTSGSSSNLPVKGGETFKKVRTNSQASLTVGTEEDRKNKPSNISINSTNARKVTRASFDEEHDMIKPKSSRTLLKSKEDISIPIPRASVVKNPNRVSVVKSPKSPNAFSDGSRFAQYMLVFPQKQTLDEIRQEEMRSSFYSFRAIVDRGTERIGEEKTRELFGEFSSFKNLKTQLNFNKQQERLFLTTAEAKLFDTSSKLGQMVRQKESIVKQMPIVKIKPSIRYPEPSKLTFDEEISPSLLEEDESKLQLQHPKYINFFKFGPNDKYNFHWRIESDEDKMAWRPHVVEGASFAISGKYGYLYGGRSKEVNNNLSILDLTNWTWEKAAEMKDAPQFGRCGHSANMFQKYMVIFGGVKNYNPMLNSRECLNDIHFYNIELNKWKYVRCSGEFVEARRHHVGVTVGKHLLIHGGINSAGQYLGDIKIFGLISHRWSSCNDFSEPEDTEGIAFHTACLVVHDQRKDFDLYKLPCFQRSEATPVIKEEGIYFFGGRYSDENSSNTLKILKIGGPKLRWIKPVTIGKPPLSRYLHTMTHCKTLNMLVVYGGRNDSVYSNNLSPVLGDFYTLQLETLTWVAVKNIGIHGSARCAHIAGVAGTSLLIFGGINFNVYCKSELNVIEMSQTAVKSLVKIQDKSRNPTEIVEPVVISPRNKPKDDLFKKLRTPSIKLMNIQTFLPIPPSYPLSGLRSAGPNSPKTSLSNKPSLSARRLKTGSYGG